MNEKPTMTHTASYGKRLIEALKDPQEAQTYLEGAFEGCEETGEIEGLLLALRNVAEAQGGVGGLARRAGVNREHLYRVLSSQSKPKAENLLAILSGLGFRVRLERQGAPAR